MCFSLVVGLWADVVAALAELQPASSGQKRLQPRGPGAAFIPEPPLDTRRPAPATHAVAAQAPQGNMRKIRSAASELKP